MTPAGGFVPLVGQQLRVLFSRSADFVLAKLTGARVRERERGRMAARRAVNPRTIDRSNFRRELLGSCIFTRTFCPLLSQDSETEACSQCGEGLRFITFIFHEFCNALVGEFSVILRK